jgi:hypothetical protein
MLSGPQWQELWSPIAEYTIRRRTYIANKILGPKTIEFASVACPSEEVWDMEEKSYRQHLAILGPMPNGDHDWLLDETGKSRWTNLMMDHLRLTEPELFRPGGPLSDTPPRHE